MDLGKLANSQTRLKGTTYTSGCECDERRWHRIKDLAVLKCHGPEDTLFDDKGQCSIGERNGSFLKGC